MRKPIIFEGKKIRSIFYNGEWYFSVLDVVGILSESINSQSYWRKLKQRLIEEGNETVTKCHGLKMRAMDGKLRLTDSLNKEGIFRIIQSIPSIENFIPIQKFSKKTFEPTKFWETIYSNVSKKAEPFKRWLAKVGSEMKKVKYVNYYLLEKENQQSFQDIKMGVVVY